MGIKEKIDALRDKIARAADRAGQPASDILLVAVIKGVPDDLVREALGCGISHIGENRVQEAQSRFQKFRSEFPGISLHMIGHLQRNKVRQALDIFDIIQSVDSQRLVDEIDQKAVRPIPALIEVNTSGERSKYGIEPEHAADLVRSAQACKHLTLQGLMTVGPLSGGPDASRRAFRSLRQLRDEIAAAHPAADLRLLSMGMSDDFEIAIEEGSNLVRIGRS